MVAQKFSEGNIYVLEIWRGGHWSHVRTYSSSAWACHQIRKAPDRKYRIIKKDAATDDVIAVSEVDIQLSLFGEQS